MQSKPEPKPRLRHVNAAFCPLCASKLIGVDSRLVEFAQVFRAQCPDAHISWGLRGRKDQEDALKKGTTRAKFGESPHNFGMALDWFRLTVNGAEFDRPWYMAKLGPAALKANLTWGATFTKLMDMPHVEIRGWEAEVVTKGLKPVE